MNIQLLDGIDIQMLDGTTQASQLTTTQRELLRKLQEKGRKEEAGRLGVINTITNGYTNSVNNELEFVANGCDFAGYGKGAVSSDEEMIRNHLVRTKRVIDASPNIFSGFGNVDKLSTMLGYVIANWDTEHREDVLDEMIRQENSAIDNGEFNYNVAEDMGDLSAEDVTDIDNWDILEYSQQLNGDIQLTPQSSQRLVARRKNAKTGIFSAVKKAVGNRNMTSEAKDVVACNPATFKLRKAQRAKTAQTRNKAQLSVGNRTAKITTVSDDAGVNGIDNETFNVINGTSLEYAIKDIDPIRAYYNYLKESRDLVMQRPLDCFDSQQEAQYYINAVDTILRSWHDERLRTQVLDKIINEPDSLDGLFKKIKNAVKKVGSAVKKAVKKVGTAVKKAVKAVGNGLKKLGKAIAKVTKKVWKFVVRFNPLTLLIRAGLLAACRLNMFKMANKCYIGSLSKADALKKGATEDEWKKSNEAYGHLKKPFVKIGGKEEKLKKALEKGNKKKWTGAEYPDKESDIKTAAAKVATAADDKETNADVTEAQNEMKAKGAVQDKTVSADVESVSVKTQVEVVENEKTAKVATKLYEEGATTAKVLLSIPKGAKVLIDEKQGDTTYYAATYNNKTGYIKRSDLAGVFDSESVAVVGLSELYDMGYFSGLGEPATAASAAAASGVIASILAKIKKIFGAIKNVATKVVSKVKNVVTKAETVKNNVQNVKEKVSDTVKTVSNTVSNTTKKAAIVTTPVSTVNTNKVANNVDATKKPASQIPNKSIIKQSITMYVTAKSGLVMRATASTSANKITAIPYASKVTLVNGGGNVSGWKNVSYGGKIGWCSSTYLSKTKPIEQTKTVTTPASSTTQTVKQTTPTSTNQTKTVSNQTVVANGKTYTSDNTTLLKPATEIQSVATQASIGGGNSAKKWFLLGGGLLIAGLVTMFSLRKNNN